jgi:AP-2 complex subunit beta-1
MSDAKFFQRGMFLVNLLLIMLISIGKVQELRQELLEIDAKKDHKNQKRRTVLKKIVANMTMGNDMSPLFPDVMACMQISDLEIKKMVYLYLVNYAKAKPELVLMAVNSFIRVGLSFLSLLQA